MVDSLIPDSELTELKSADSVKDVADSAEKIIEKQMCAHAINSAANTGSHLVYYDHPISDSLKEDLESLGYEIVKENRAADPRVHWVIKGF